MNRKIHLITKQLFLIKKNKFLFSINIQKRCNSYLNNILADIKILDLTRIVAGPFCTMILSDMGAEVIKVEKPGSGDEARKWGPPFIENTTESCYFMSVNRNKKSICINLKTDKGRRLIYELGQISDVLVENYIPGTLEKYKLGYEDVKIGLPHLIYCSITGYGSEGPFINKPGYDVIAASLGGLLSITGPTNGEPVKVGIAITDLATGLYAHGAILAALIQRSKTGRGQKIDCNLLSTQVACLINIGSNYLNCGKEGQRWGSAHESLVPYQMFRTKDGYLTIGAGSDSQFRDLCKRIGMEVLGNEPMYQTNALRVENRVMLTKVIENIIENKTNKEWLDSFANCSFPYGPVNKISEVFNDPHIKALNIVKSLEHPSVGNIKVVGPPVRYSEGINAVRSSPPMLGEHTDNILSTYLSYSADKIEELRKLKVVQ